MSNNNGPKRSDAAFTGGIQKSLINANLAIIVLGVVILGSIALNFALLQQPKLTTVIDTSSGKSYSSNIYQGKLPFSLIEKQLIYYSRKYVETYLSNNYITIQGDRKEAFELMHPQMRKDLPKDFLEEVSFRSIRELKQTSTFKWIIKPTVIDVGDPRYAVFTQFERVISTPGYKDQVEKFSIKLDWGRLNTVVDPFKRPHSLVLLSFNKLQDGDPQINSYLSKVK